MGVTKLHFLLTLKTNSGDFFTSNRFGLEALIENPTQLNDWLNLCDAFNNGLDDDSTFFIDTPEGRVFIKSANVEYFQFINYADLMKELRRLAKNTEFLQDNPKVKSVFDLHGATIYQ